MARTSSRRRCRTSATRTSPAPASRSPATTLHRRLGGDAALARLRAAAAPARPAADARFRPEPHRPGPSVGGRTPGVFRRRHRSRIWPRRRRTTSGRHGDARRPVLAHGRDPYFSGWPDTLQLNYGNPALQDAMIGSSSDRRAVRRRALRHGDAACCPRSSSAPGAVEPEPFWPGAIRRVRERVPGFCFMAEVYWDLEWTLQQQGFDYTYDKRLYDRLRDGHARPVRQHLRAGLDFQDKLARFLENHDEPRAAATFAPGMHQAAAVITLPVAGPAILPSGPVRRPQDAHLAAPRPRAARTDRRPAAGLLRPPARRAAPPRRSRRGLAAARVPAGVGWQLDVGLFRGVALDRPDG